jgi:hypothetical protein
MLSKINQNIVSAVAESDEANIWPKNIIFRER